MTMAALPCADPPTDAPRDKEHPMKLRLLSLGIAATLLAACGGKYTAGERASVDGARSGVETLTQTGVSGE